ncbi:MAG: hypothetical protein COT34_00250 [Candidatus Nealsonbacteria bacterium CG08_land_8_20_14_0_20_43_11]|uniref:Orotidine 5'-phosphate decarboxylase domain-containing protein n=1 Tax=Candidatus Nealsonbacteria bacterium CG08_land_8_20_14_0_20_43_11 TaxID=1974706 RepID=A0A2M6T193_9BACT|nr:MAG: hypothetical protein COT34_00250 [Candidatus Nealsonbacteria bacterium CG08_land_8_20_14_0_20_43_11]
MDFFIWLIIIIVIAALMRKKGAPGIKSKRGVGLPILSPFHLASLKSLAEILNEVAKEMPQKIQQKPERKAVEDEGALPLPQKASLDKRKKYLQVALNSTIAEAEMIISQLPHSDRILVEAGTPLIKSYGMRAISQIKANCFSNWSYVVADIKTADMAEREVELAARVGASAATCLGVAPVETIDYFIESCKKNGIDSIIDMMNVENPILILRQLKEPPVVVIVHRGVDETETVKGKPIPYYQINQIKGNCNTMVAVAGGDTIQEIRSAIFNGADIVVVWKAFYGVQGDVAELVKEFLKEIR